MKKRFVIETTQIVAGSREINVLVDTETGVCYLAYNGGITPMVNSRGEVLIDSDVFDYGEDEVESKSLGSDEADGEGFDDEFEFNR